MKPFIKWAGGKRWLAQRADFEMPKFSGRYIEPFVGGGAMLFHVRPKAGIASDLNPRLIETYQAVAQEPTKIKRLLLQYQRNHSREYYYSEREVLRKTPVTRAAQFLYLNRTCWNGLYRENLSGKFNVPIGTKTKIHDVDENLEEVSELLKPIKFLCQDFEKTIAIATKGDLVFVDPPYTTAHNLNGFIKYNQSIFSWQDQQRLKESVFSAKKRGAAVIVTNAYHSSIEELYREAQEVYVMDRSSVISGINTGRKATAELVIRV